MNDFEREKLHLTGHGFPKTIHTLMLARPKGKLHLTGHDSVFQKNNSYAHICLNCLFQIS
jgi:hypothetical protein